MADWRKLTTWDDVRPRTAPPIGAFQAEFDRQVSRAIDAVVVEQAMDMHGDLWGVPVGPALSMVHPPKMLGIAWLVQDRSQP